MDEPIRPSELARLTGDERLGDTTVLDFWRWALGDLRMNNARGYLVEYLVAQAVGDVSPTRVEWGAYDVESADGTRIEVKATGRLQSWVTKRQSTPNWSFRSVRTSREWSPDVGDYIEITPADRVHVWVFALHTAIEPALYDPLDLAQWEFRVVPHRTLLNSAQTNARISFFQGLGVDPVPYVGLRDAVTAARQANDARA